MPYRFQFRRYRLPFRAPVRTAHGLWSERQGVLVRMEDEAGLAGYGEAAPIPHFGGEAVDEIEAACRAVGEWPDDRTVDAVPVELGCLRHAIATARAGLGGSPSRAAAQHKAIGVAALLPAGRAALSLVGPKAEIGYRVFKWKVGVADVAEEISLLDDLCAVLPAGARLRLDANGAWERRQAERWLERCAERPVEFIEQPAFAKASEGGSARRKTDELLLGLANDYPTPLALDESVAGDGDVERWIGLGWPGIFVMKTGLHGDVAGTLARLAKAKAPVVFSSALETAVGARAALRIAFAWSEGAKSAPTVPPRALGFGVWPLFVDARVEGPTALPYLRAEDVERIDVEAAWNALS